MLSPGKESYKLFIFPGLAGKRSEVIVTKTESARLKQSVNSTGCGRNRQSIGSVALRSQYRLREEKANEEKNNDKRKKPNSLSSNDMKRYFDDSTAH